MAKCKYLDIECPIEDVVRDDCRSFNCEEYETAKAEMNHTTFELCPHCMGESEIAIDKVGICKHCGESILPCSMCMPDETCA